MNQRKVSFIVVSGERKINDFMKAFDLRDDNKAFVSIRKVVLTSDISDQNLFESFKEALKKEYHLVYLLCESQPNLVYRDNKVKVISDGQCWVVLDDYLKSQGYPESLVIDAVKVTAV